MEDQSSKMQWYKGKMVKRDYVTSGNIISDAAAADYVRSFQEALNSELDEYGDVQRTLTMLKGGALQLDFEIKIHVLRSARVAKYTFVLDPVSVERFDVLESKMRDQKEELEQLRKKLDVRHAHIELVASTKATSSSNLLWRAVESDSFFVNNETGEVSIHQRGFIVSPGWW
ncbi:hypothetical protein PsorP6_015963 [Peronosclerospora sorghi]|uniref:Uncharacterized protein n=1 Tax=Peronosclerospora sorghi TaxID=230839 RepID=A0ACC0WP88_9STRA|nr:hypothetical protein PsorP6_015963 [Peronosclerospora sorghi]